MDEDVSLVQFVVHRRTRTLCYRSIELGHSHGDILHYGVAYLDIDRSELRFEMLACVCDVVSDEEMMESSVYFLVHFLKHYRRGLGEAVDQYDC